MVGRHVDLSGVDNSEILAMIDRGTSGDRGAAAILIDGIAPVLWKRVGKALSRWRPAARGRGLRHDLEDLVQETFAGLFDDGGRALRAWDPARGLGFLGFVGLFAEREVGMRMRTRKRNPWTEDPMAHDSLSSLRGPTEPLAIRIEARDQLRHLFARAYERLSQQGRSYLQLLVVEGRSVQAVAEETGASAEALYAWRARLTKLVRELRTELEATDIVCLGSPRERHASRCNRGPAGSAHGPAGSAYPPAGSAGGFSRRVQPAGSAGATLTVE